MVLLEAGHLPKLKFLATSFNQGCKGMDMALQKENFQTTCQTRSRLGLLGSTTTSLELVGF